LTLDRVRGSFMHAVPDATDISFTHIRSQAALLVAETTVLDLVLVSGIACGTVLMIDIRLQLSRVYTIWGENFYVIILPASSLAASFGMHLLVEAGNSVLISYQFSASSRSHGHLRTRLLLYKGK
jgi:hypothetical protein